MVNDKQVISYLRAIEPSGSKLLDEIEKDALNNHVPIIQKEIQSLLKVILSMVKPKKILEIGTAVGFSSILMSDYLPTGGEIITLERSEKMIQKAKENIKKANKEDLITLIEGDANITLPRIKKEFDVVFMDAAKGQYMNFFSYCFDLVKDNGLIISDNVLRDGSIAKSRFSVPRRQRTIHRNLREYLWYIKHHEELETTILPVADGIALSYKKLKG